MKPGDVLRHPQVFYKLSIPPINVDEFLHSRLARLTTNPVTTMPVLDEIRDVSFYIPFNDVEAKTKPITARIVTIIAQLSTAPNTPEFVKFRVKLLDLLGILNFRFHQFNYSPTDISVFFKLITDGTMEEMSASIKLLRQTFEMAESLNKVMLKTICQNTLTSGERRIRWFIENHDSIDISCFSPFLTLLTVLSFCSQKYQQYMDPIIKIFKLTEGILKNNKFDIAHISRQISLISIKVRLAHSLMLSIDSVQRDQELSFLMDVYLNFLENFPSEYSAITDEVCYSFTMYLSLRKEEERMERMIKAALTFFQIPFQKADYYSIGLKFFEVFLHYNKLPDEMIGVFIDYATKTMHNLDDPLNSRFRKFLKLIELILKRITLSTNYKTISKYLFQILFNFYHGLQLIGENIINLKIDQSSQSIETKQSLQTFLEVVVLFDIFYRLIDFICTLFKLIQKFQMNLEKIKQMQQSKEGSSQYQLKPANPPPQQQQPNTQAQALTQKLSQIQLQAQLQSQLQSHLQSQMPSQLPSNLQSQLQAQLQLHSQQSRNLPQNSSQFTNQAHHIEQFQNKISFPFDCTESTILINMYVRSLIIFMRMRVIFHQCNLKFTNKTITSDYLSNMKKCANHMKYAKYYDRVRVINQIIFKCLTDALENTRAPVLMNIWHHFIKKIITSYDLDLNDATYFRFILGKPILFSTFFSSYVKEVTTSLQTPTNLTFLFRLGNHVMETLIDVYTAQEMKLLMAQKIISEAKILIKSFEFQFTFLQDASEALFLIINLEKFISVALKKADFISETLTEEFINTICSSIQDWPSDLSSLLNFISFCNQKCPKSVENDTVISCLINAAEKKSKSALSILYSILKRKPDLGNTSKISRISEISINSLIYSPDDKSFDLLLKFIKRYPPEFLRPDSSLTKKCVFVFVNNDRSIQLDAEMFLTAFTSVVENSDEDYLWDFLLDFVSSIIGLNSSEEENLKKNYFIQSGYCDYKNVVSTVLVYIASFAKKRKNRVFNFFHNLINRNLQIIQTKDDFMDKYVLILMPCIQYIQEIGEEIIDFSFINSKVDFSLFLTKSVEVCEQVLPNSSTKELILAQIIMKTISVQNIESLLFVQFIIHAISISPIILAKTNNNDFRSNATSFISELNFSELNALPQLFIDIIIKTKEFISESSKHFQNLFQILKCSSSHWMKLIILEFIVSSGFTLDLIESFLNEISQICDNEQNLQTKLDLYETLCLVIIAFPNTIDKHIEKILIFLDQYSNSKQEKLSKNDNLKLSAIIYSVLKSSNHEVSQHIAHINLNILSIEDLSPDFLVVLQEKLNNEKFFELLESLTNKFGMQNIVNIIKTFNSSDKSKSISLLQNWNDIKFSWVHFFYLFKSQFVSFLTSQFKQFSNGENESLPIESLPDFYMSTSSIISQKLIVTHIIENNLFNSVIQSFLNIFDRYNAMLTDEMYSPLIFFLENSGDLAINFLSNFLVHEQYSSTLTYILQLPAAKKLKEYFFSNKDFILSKLNCFDQLNKIIINLALLSPGTSNFKEYFINPFVKIFRERMLLKQDLLTFVLFVSIIIKHYDDFKPYIMDIVCESIINYDCTKFSYIKRIIDKLIDDPSTTKESISTPTFPDESSFSTYSKYVICPFIKIKSKSLSQEQNAIKSEEQILTNFFLEKYGSSISNKIILIHLFLKSLNHFVFYSTQSYELYKASNSDLEKDLIFYIWSLSKQNGNFDEMFTYFMDSINVHLTTYSKTVLGSLKIPEGSDIKNVIKKFEASALTYMKHPTVLMYIWAFFKNNIEVILTGIAPHASSENNNCDNDGSYYNNINHQNTVNYQYIWSLVLTQVANIRFYTKKKQIHLIQPIAESITLLFSKYPPPPTFNHQVVLYFSNFLITTLKSLIDINPSANNKIYVPFIKCCIQLLKTYGHQFTIGSEIIRMFLDLVSKCIQQNILKSNSSNPVETLLPYIKKMIPIILKFDPPYNLDSIVDVIIQLSQLTSLTLCPHTCSILYMISNFGSHNDKIRKILDNIEKDDIGLFLFPVFWMNNAFSDTKIPILLPYIIKRCAKDAQDIPHHYFLLKIAFKTIVDFPCNQSIQKLFSELTQPQLLLSPQSSQQCLQNNQQNSRQQVNKPTNANPQFIQIIQRKYAILLLGSILLSTPKSRFISNYISNCMEDPKICLYSPLAVSVEQESEIQFQLPLLAQIAFAAQYVNSSFLSIIENSYDIKTIFNSAQKISAYHIPLSIALNNIFSNKIPMKILIRMARLIRTEFSIMAIESYLLPSLIRHSKISYKTNILNKICADDKLKQWNVVEEALPSLSEYQSFDLNDSHKQKASSVVAFLHHGMLTHALFSAKKSLNDICKDDLMRIRMKDAAFPSFSEEWIKEEIPTLHNTLLINTKNLPSKARIPFSNKLASLIMYTYLIKIDRMIKSKKKFKFGKGLSHFFTPSAHKAFAELRKAAFSLLKLESNVEYEREERTFKKLYTKSLRQNFIEERPILPSADELLNQIDINYKKLLLCFSPQIGNKEWRLIFETIAIKGLKINPNNDILFSLLYSLLKEKDFDIEGSVISIPSNWANLFASLKNPKVYHLLPKSFWPIIPPPICYKTEIHRSFLFLLESAYKRLNNILEENSNIKDKIFIFDSSLLMFNEKHIILPFNSSDTIEIDNVLPFANIVSPNAIQIFIRDTNGEKITYLISKNKIMHESFSMFANVINRLFCHFVDTFRRGISLASYQSCEIEINNDTFYLTKTDAIPISSSYVKKPSNQFVSKREYINWNSIFSYRYSALCCLQQLFNSPTFNINEMTIDTLSALVTVPEMIYMKETKSLFMLNGLIKEIIDDIMLYGPFKSGFISGMLSIVYHREKIYVLLKTLISLNNDQANESLERASQLSIAENNIEDVEKKVITLIKESADYSTDNAPSVSYY